MSTFTLSPAAKQDLKEILHYKAEYDIDYALNFVDKLVERYKETLSVFPESGSVYNDNIRKIAFEGYTAFYTIDEAPKNINILRIIDLGKPLKARGISFS